MATPLSVYSMPVSRPVRLTQVNHSWDALSFYNMRVRRHVRITQVSQSGDAFVSIHHLSKSPCSFNTVGTPCPFLIQYASQSICPYIAQEIQSREVGIIYMYAYE